MSDLLKQRIQDDMKSAMRAKDQHVLATVRLLLAAIKQREIDEKVTLDDQNVLQVIDKMVKQRRDSITQFQAAGRNELAEKEQSEIDILQQYLPPQLTDTEIDALIDEAVSTTSATSMKDMGKLMGALKPKLQGRADMSIVSKKIKEKLN